MAPKTQLTGPALEIALTAANAAAQAWYGYDQGVISGILIGSDFIKTFPQTRDTNIQGITASCFSVSPDFNTSSDYWTDKCQLGNLAGCLFAALFGDRLGRKNTLRTGATISAIGAILQFSATSFPQFIVGRVINGMGNGKEKTHLIIISADLNLLGMTSSTCGMFQAESCLGPRRGKLSVIVVLHNVVFYCLASWLTLACSFATNGLQWRLPLALQLVPCTVLVLLLPHVPESPRWLLMHDRTEEAHQSLRRYLGKDLSLNDPKVLTELYSIEGAIRIERQSRISFKEVILSRDRSGHLKRLLLGCGGQFMQQFGGINALNYYFPIILTENIGLSELMARILTGCNATSYMISSGLCFWMIERFGRRSLMLSGLGLQCFSYIMVAIAIALLTDAPFQVSSTVCDGDRVLICGSGEPLLSHSSLATTQHSAALGEWFPGCIRQRSTRWRCELRAQLRRRQQIG
jgi:MFS family permease